MPLVDKQLIMECNNQLRSVTIEVGLISKKDVDSCTWLLTCFKKLLEREPSVIVTDQDASMKAAIPTIFPSSRHRFCMWHITKKLQVKVDISKYKESGFLNSINVEIWGEYNVCKEFEEAWWELITKYDLHGNKWHADMYDIRLSWIPVYFRDVNMGALLRTTLHSESMNSFFGRIPDYMVMARWNIDAARKYNPGMFLVDPKNPYQHKICYRRKYGSMSMPLYVASRMMLISLENSMITSMSLLRSMLRMVVWTVVHQKPGISGLFCKCHSQQTWWSIILERQEIKDAVREFEVPEKLSWRNQRNHLNQCLL
ncbi:hypothetical protein QQ045_008905 [Rhodiola kirilowii]